MQDGSASRRGFFVAGLVGGLGAVLMPNTVRAAVAGSVAPPRRVAELPQGKAQLGRVLLELNDTARFIYDRCDGTRTTDAIAQDMAKTYDVTLRMAQDDVVSCVAELRKMGLVQ